MSADSSIVSERNSRRIKIWGERKIVAVYTQKTLYGSINLFKKSNPHV